VILQENRDAEVTDLLPQPNGDLYAALVYAGSSGESRINKSKPGGDKSGLGPLAPAVESIFEASTTPEKFSGRSTLVWFPAGGFPETLVTRGSLAFYRLARRGDTLLIAGGDNGDVLGFDLQTRNGLTFAGSVAAQLNGLAPLAGASGRYLLLKNNAPGFALLDFSASGPREAETRRLDLGQPSQLGALRFNRLRGLEDTQVTLSLKTNFGSDEVEGWTPWTPLTSTDGGWHADGLRGRYAKLRVQLPVAAREGAELDKDETTSSEMMSAHLKEARLVKGFNTIYFKHLATQGDSSKTLEERRAIFIAGDDSGALMAAGQEVSAPDLAAGVRQFRGHDDERRQVLVFSTQAIADPGANAWPGDGNRAGVDSERGLEMIVVIAMHGANHREVVHRIADVREQVRHFDAGFTARFGSPLRREEFAAILSIGGRLGFGIERIDMRHPTAQVNKDDAFRRAWKMRRPRSQWIVCARGCVLPQQLAQQRREQARSEKERPYGLAPRHRK